MVGGQLYKIGLALAGDLQEQSLSIYVETLFTGTLFHFSHVEEALWSPPDCLLSDLVLPISISISVLSYFGGYCLLGSWGQYAAFRQFQYMAEHGRHCRDNCFIEWDTLQTADCRLQCTGCWRRDNISLQSVYTDCSLRYSKSIGMIITE